MVKIMEFLTIGQLAKEANVNIETIRFYERRGLIPEPPRQESGYRQYTPDYAIRIKFIKRAQEVGFTLKEVGELLSLRVEPRTYIAAKKQASAKITDIQDKVRSLKDIKAALSKMVATRNEDELSGESPILDFLDMK